MKQILSTAFWVGMSLYVGLFVAWFALSTACLEEGRLVEECGDNVMSKVAGKLYPFQLLK